MDAIVFQSLSGQPIVIPSQRSPTTTHNLPRSVAGMVPILTTYEHPYVSRCNTTPRALTLTPLATPTFVATCSLRRGRTSLTHACIWPDLPTYTLPDLPATLLAVHTATPSFISQGRERDPPDTAAHGRPPRRHCCLAGLIVTFPPYHPLSMQTTVLELRDKLAAAPSRAVSSVSRAVVASQSPCPQHRPGPSRSRRALATYYVPGSHSRTGGRA
ncbi:hypothetical protein PCL_10963 [Purpureocillium lilacinum]|uniref:Uncharacterized protein n=1 Tax=Purpureocillium lilacinum TaxID=33203 RepID=A0A2U3ECZ9_PURLI|nr:hypothetical protein PCL_10963 [Purpureocillium lilacinum]